MFNLNLHPRECMSEAVWVRMVCVSQHGSLKDLMTWEHSLNQACVDLAMHSSTRVIFS